MSALHIVRWVEILAGSFATNLKAQSVGRGNYVRKRLYSDFVKSSSMAGSTNIFKGDLDRYNGVMVNCENETCELNEFITKLDESLVNWTESNRRAIWFKIGINQADWVPVLAKRGFKFHHTRDNLLVMYKWLPLNQQDRIPSYAHTMIGVGGLVVNDKKQILVVSEKYYKYPHWKLPGGGVDPGENLTDAVIREVQEETNIKAEFHSLLTIRHTHNRQFGCSDLYIVCSLKPKTNEIIKCEREISECKWMDMQEYLNHPNIHSQNKLIVKQYLEFEKKNIRIACDTGVHEVLKIPYNIYHVVTE